MNARTRRTTLALAAVTVTALAGCQARHQAPEASPSRQSSGQPAAPSSGHPAAPAPRTGFTLVASGDIVPDTSIIERAQFDAGGLGYDFRPMLAGSGPAVSGADLAICHMNAVYGEDGDPSGSPALKAPPQMADALAATGYDGCSTASDHSLDDGADGIRRTLDAFDRAGVRHAGSARTQEEAKSVTMMRAGDAQVAHLAYTVGPKDRSLPEGQPWAVDLLDRDKIVEDARVARRAGADVVVVSLHWGTEWQDAPDEQQLKLAKQLTASRTGGRADIDLILGTHAHVPQAYEKVDGTWVVYGLGDQIAGETDSRGIRDPRGNVSTIARFTFAPPAHEGERWPVARAEFVPQAFDVDAGRVVDLTAALQQGADVGALRDRIRDVVLSRGAAQAGLVMAQ
ncbi:CapA family protein [Streptomyces sp. 142MFCol3.1]|uniref:CapA family protein n=1 Tax=Streptomyces sp. 142MFCol3.1 TaxID=1172179 RepID=UPI0004913038|nr:CapA family protein [Streptomyces sp. 142MFCol3.1]